MLQQPNTEVKPGKLAARKRAPGAGRPGITGKIGGGEALIYRVRVTLAQRDKIDARGGGVWLRGLIDAAK